MSQAADRLEKTPPKGHCYHLVCTICGSNHPLHCPDLETVLQNLTDSRGFAPLRYDLEIFGQCPSCQDQARPRPGLPLSLAATGERLRVERLGGAKDLVARLQDLGLTVGTELEVISTKAYGALLVAVRGARVALGRGVARNILVSQMA